MPSKGNLIVAQSGGPTVAINSTLVGVVQEALEQDGVGGVYGAQNGIRGVLEEKLIDLGRVPGEILEGLRGTPAAALGTVRHKLSDDDYDRLLEKGTKPNLARLSIARKIAATVLSMWKNQEVYDPVKYRVTDK